AEFLPSTLTAREAEGEILAHRKDLDPVEAAASVDGEKPVKCSLLDIAGEYEDIVLPPRLTGTNASCASTASPALSSNGTLDPFIQEPMITGNASMESPLLNPNTAPASCTPSSQSSAQTIFPPPMAIPPMQHSSSIKRALHTFRRSSLISCAYCSSPHLRSKSGSSLVQKDLGLPTFETSTKPTLHYLTKFVANQLKLSKNDLMGLIRCEAYHVVAKKITEEVNKKQLIDELNKAMDSLEAELKGPAGLTTAEEQDVVKDKDLAIEDTNYLFMVINQESVIEAAGQWWSGDQLLWATLPNHLINISHVITRWLPSCTMLNETSKLKKGKQGIKDLSSKNGCLLLTAFQSAVFASSKTWFEKSASTSLALTCIKHKPIVINVNCKDEQDIELPLPSKKNKSKKSTNHPVYTISSNSEEFTQPPFKDILTNSGANCNA
ncbi:hypothetical protein C0995_010337, partial [Termitomyces sp. Mi166